MTFPSDLGDVAMIVGYGDVGSVVSSVIVTEETRGSVQVGYAVSKTCGRPCNNYVYPSCHCRPK